MLCPYVRKVWLMWEPFLSWSKLPFTDWLAMDSIMFPSSRLAENGIVMYPVSQKNCLNILWWWVVRQSSLNTILAEKIRLWPRLGLPRQRKKSSFVEADGTRSVQHWQVVLSTKTQADSSMKKSGFALSPCSCWANIRSEYLFIKLIKTICIARYILSKCINYRDLFNWKRINCKLLISGRMKPCKTFRTCYPTFRTKRVGECLP